jgi:hypothetical protein
LFDTEILIKSQAADLIKSAVFSWAFLSGKTAFEFVGCKVRSFWVTPETHLEKYWANQEELPHSQGLLYGSRADYRDRSRSPQTELPHCQTG